MAKIYAPTDSSVSAMEKDNAAKACAIAASGMVVLKNNGILPMKGITEVALFGSGARHTVKGGTGSGDVNSRSVVNLEQGFTEKGIRVLGGSWCDRLDAIIEEKHSEYNMQAVKAVQEKGMAAIMDLIGKPFFPPTSVPILPEELGLCDTAVYVVSRNSGEGADRHPVPGDYYLSEAETTCLDLITASYPHTIVLLNVGGVIDTTYFRGNDKIDAVLLMSQAGNNSGLAAVMALTGEVEPSGRLTTTWAKDYKDYASAETFSHMNGDLDDEYYEDGIYVGYRYFDSFGIEPAYPFGFGLGYTTFEISEAKVIADEETVGIAALVTNTGKLPGREVVQVYVSAPYGKIEKPYQELKAYAKTDVIEPGKSRLVTLSFDTASMASYDEEKAQYVLEDGDYIIRIGHDSRSTNVCAVLQLDADAVTVQLKNLFALDCELAEITAVDAEHYSYAGEAEEIAKAPKLVLKASAFRCEKADYANEAIELSPVSTNSPITYDDVVSGKYTVSDLVSQLTDEEMADFCIGGMRSLGGGSIIGNASATVPGAAGDSSSIIKDSRNVRTMVLADGPAGLRLTKEFYVGEDNAIYSTASPLPGLEALFPPQAIPEGAVAHYQYATAIPIATLLAQTWDVEAIEAAGELVGKEMDFFGVDLWLAPGMNIHRNPLCGRNFEYYSEDPLVSGKCAAADTKGVQKHKGGTTIKHFAFNNQEDNRLHVNSHVSERAAREIYLKGFEICIRESHPKSLMTSYNLENGIHSANNRELLTDFARSECGFDGVVMTDWGTTGSLTNMSGDADVQYKYGNSRAALCVHAGNDWTMPGSDGDVQDILNGLKEGVVTRAELQACCVRIIESIIKCD